MDAQPVPLNFSQGLDQKSDPKAIPFGKFFKLYDRVFNKLGLLEKRNGFGPLPALPNATSTYTTTFGGNLTAIGNTIEALANGNKRWISKGNFQPISMDVKPVVRSALGQTQCDSVVAANGFVCTVFTEVNNGTNAYKYVIQDSVTGQNIVSPTVIPVASGVATGSPRVFLLNATFVIIFTNVITGTSHLQYVAVSSTDPTVVSANTDIAANYISETTLSWDAVVVNDHIYIAYNTTSGGQKINITYMTTGFNIASPVSFVGSIATIMSMCADVSTPSHPVIYAAFWDSSGSTGNVVAVDLNLNKVMTPTAWLSTGTILNVATAAQNGAVTIIYEYSNNYSYDSGIPSHYLSKNTVTLPMTVTTGTLGTATVLLRSVGLASKPFILNSTIYVLTTYSSVFQPTYFLINISGQAIAKFAYQNGGGYLTKGLPQAQVFGSQVWIAYLFKDLIQAVNKTQGVASAAGVYSQTGVNLALITYGSENLSTSEIGHNLNISGGFLYAYDGNTLNEQNFHLYPDNVEATWSDSGGSIHAQPSGSINTNAYYYQVIFQWTDAQGNIFNSAPSLPVAVTTTGTGTAGSITITGPNARITYKSGIKIIIYRWSIGQENYFQATSLTAPLLNSTTADSWTFTDTLADASIIGNSLIYTTGGVIENTGGPCCSAMTLFDTRQWLIDAEDPNLLWYSKQVIQGTPVEMSDLFTLYVAPNAGVTASTGPMKCIYPMDDKLIIFKSQSLFYINGSGPDNLGSNNQYSQPIFITATVGSINQNSIILTPYGLMFQSDKGIWLLGRDLQTSYIGAPVENTNESLITSAVAIPKTTQIRFTLGNGTALMYDYYYQEWVTFRNIDAVSSTLYQNLHTYVSSIGGVSQETPNKYLDNGNPVVTGFVTGWINLAALQGFQRFKGFYFLGQYFTPHKLQVQIAYNYVESTYQSILIQPNNFSSATPSPYGDQPAPFGSPIDPEQWKVNPQIQKCESFKLTVDEIYDPSFGVECGAGLSLSGLNLLLKIKRGSRPIRVSQTAG